MSKAYCKYAGSVCRVWLMCVFGESSERRLPSAVGSEPAVLIAECPGEAKTAMGVLSTFSRHSHESRTKKPQWVRTHWGFLVRDCDSKNCHGVSTLRKLCFHFLSN